MRVAAGSAVAAARSIALFSRRVVMALKSPSFSAAKVAGFGKVRVNRIKNATLLADTGRPNQARR